MIALVVTCAHAFKTADGKYYTPSVYSYGFFRRYLNVFDNVKVVARTRPASDDEVKGYLQMCGDGLTIHELPYFQGIHSMIKRFLKLRRSARRAADGCDCIIYRVPQIESYLTYLFGKNKKKPFAVEVVASPLDWQIVSGIFKKVNVSLLRRMVRKANGVAYVTKEYLQRLYPCTAMLFGETEEHFQGNYSSIELKDSDVGVPRKYLDVKADLKIVHVANAIETNEKGHRELIDITKDVREQGHNVNTYFIGDGSLVSELKNYVNQLGLDDSIYFVGRLGSTNEVLEFLSKSDLMLFPTYTEGLPRCIIEAAATGLPVLSTPVGGIPELIDCSYLFEPQDIKGFSDKLIRLINNSEKLEDMSKANIETAQGFTESVLRLRRDEFYKKLRKLAEK